MTYLFVTLFCLLAISALVVYHKTKPTPAEIEPEVEPEPYVPYVYKEPKPFEPVYIRRTHSYQPDITSLYDDSRSETWTQSSSSQD